MQQRGHRPRSLAASLQFGKWALRLDNPHCRAASTEVWGISRNVRDAGVRSLLLALDEGRGRRVSMT